MNEQDPQCQRMAQILSTLQQEKARSELILQDIIHDLSRLQVGANIHSMQLEKQVQYLTRELSKANLTLQNKITELETTRDRAIASNKAKSAFIANISRRLRMPLDAVIGYSTLILESQGSIADIRADLEQVNVGAGQILDLINDILELSELESGQRQVVMDDFIVSDFVHEVIATAIKYTNLNGNQLITDIAPDLGVMLTDMKKLRQAILHLIKSASDRIHAAQIRFSVRHELHFEQSWYVFTVSDLSGQNLPGQNFDFLFDPFIDVPVTNSHLLEGCGLGMAITKHYCNILQGRCGMQNTASEGPSFSISLPAQYHPSSSLNSSD